jgi:hypothetical protein
MMVLAHTAAGAAIGHLAPSTGTGVAVAFVAHGLLDLPQHEDPSMSQEALLTGASLVCAATLFGLRSPEFWGAFSCAAPDLEHAIPLLRRRRRLYPTHRFARLHNLLPTPRLSLSAQVAASVVILSLVARSAARR